ncbi:hypothetical protein [Paenibacillus helianthi]|uniref:hypothetical protein n=1 Tax=Paenibacillus helianthi TaxID=1349432 RepID=UPI000A3DD310|nr:hypothetical protein [Paenibacillus helianthi]
MLEGLNVWHKRHIRGWRGEEYPFEKGGSTIKKPLLWICVLLLAAIFPVAVQAAPPESKYPCSLILSAKENMPVNAKGVALVYRVLRDVGGERTSLSIHAQYLPEPASLGNYDRYEGFAQVAGEISWRFRLHPAPAGTENPTWAGRIDDITGPLERASVQVRLSNSTTNTLGPIVLESVMSKCN